MGVRTWFKQVIKNRIFFDSQLKNVLIGAGTLTQPGFRVEIRTGPIKDRVSIGANSVLSCAITLERDIGGVSIGDDTFIGTSTIICAEGIRIGAGVLISWGCTIVDHDSHSLNWHERAEDVRRWRTGLVLGGIQQASLQKEWQHVASAPITICDKAWIGFDVVILKGVTIGEGAIVAARSVVTKDVPAWTLVAGNPAREIRKVAHD